MDSRLPLSSTLSPAQIEALGKLNFVRPAPTALAGYRVVDSQRDREEHPPTTITIGGSFAGRYTKDEHGLRDIHSRLLSSHQPIAPLSSLSKETRPAIADVIAAQRERSSIDRSVFLEHALDVTPAGTVVTPQKLFVCSSAFSPPGLSEVQWNHVESTVSNWHILSSVETGYTLHTYNKEQQDGDKRQCLDARLVMCHHQSQNSTGHAPDPDHYYKDLNTYLLLKKASYLNKAVVVSAMRGDVASVAFNYDASSKLTLYVAKLFDYKELDDRRAEVIIWPGFIYILTSDKESPRNLCQILRNYFGELQRGNFKAAEAGAKALKMLISPPATAADALDNLAQSLTSAGKPSVSERLLP